MHTAARPKLLDLFCGSGGASRGYQLAGFHVTGVDLYPQPHYCGDTFIQADAMTFPLEGFDVIHASPPCQAYSVASVRYRQRGKVYADLIAAVRWLLVKSGVPWVIENVKGAPLTQTIELCGTMFGLQVFRHRLFECSEFCLVPEHRRHPAGGDYFSVVGHGDPRWNRAKQRPRATVADWRQAMGIDWMVRDELTQAIPPAYTRFIGEYLRDLL